jgi:2-polyprenyl-6-hydroxyphenyl methylase/3-demethylubiquinone-9 3-methyltransferase
MLHPDANLDPAEIAKFEGAAARWWDTSGDFRLLHDINPLRLDYIDQRAKLAGKRVVDVGCGGGILAESMAQRGAEVTGVDAAGALLTVARLHLAESGAQVDYVHSAPEEFAQAHPGEFDVVTCLEMLEHVPDPAATVAACARLVKPGGHVFFSTINRGPKSYAYAVLGAEYILGLLPRGTHDYARFIRPSELAAWARAADLDLAEINGMGFNPVDKRCWLREDVGVNYLVHCIDLKAERLVDPKGENCVSPP